MKMFNNLIKFGLIEEIGFFSISSIIDFLISLIPGTCSNETSSLLSNSEKETKSSSLDVFTPLVYLVIKRKIYSTMRQYFSSNRIHLLNSVSFNSYIEENGGSYYVSGKQTIMKDPAYIAQYKEAVQRVEQVPLSNTEKQIFHLWVSGMSYKDASSILGMTYKTYDSHLQRIKKKVKKAIYA